MSGQQSGSPNQAASQLNHNSFLLAHASLPGEFAFISDLKKKVTCFSVSPSPSALGNVEVEIQTTADVESLAGRVTAVSMCSRRDIRAIAAGTAEGKLTFPFSSHTAHIDEAPCDAIAWNPVLHHMVAVSLGNGSVTLLDVAQITSTQRILHSPASHVAPQSNFGGADGECIALSTSHIVGNTTAMEWVASMPQHLVLSTSVRSAPQLVDPRSGMLHSFGGDVDGVSGGGGHHREHRDTASRKKDRLGPVSLMSSHPYLPYIACVNSEEKKPVVTLWDARSTGRPMHRRACDEVFGYLQWYPSHNDILLAASCRSDSWMRIMRFTPNNISDPVADDGYHSSFLSTAGTSTTDATLDPFRTWRATDRSKIRNNHIFSQFCWLNLASHEGSDGSPLASDAADGTRLHPNHASSVAAASAAARVGLGTADAIVGLTPTGALHVVTLKSSPVISWISATKVIAAFEGTLMVASPVEDVRSLYRNDVAFRIRQRLREGFGIDPVANQRVARRFHDRPLEDLFRYVEIMRNLRLPASGSFPGVTQLVGEVDLQSRVRPQTTMEFFNGLPVSRQIVLELMGWIADENIRQGALRVQETGVTGMPRNIVSGSGVAETRGVSATPVRSLHETKNSSDGDHDWESFFASLDADSFERLVAIKIFLGAFDRAVGLLLLRAAKCSSYASLAALLQGVKPHERVPWSADAVQAVCLNLPDWLSIAVNFLASHWPSCAVQTNDSILWDTRIPVTDRVALAAARMRDTDALIKLLQEYERILLDNMTPTLFIMSGLNTRSIMWMQRFVDCTGDVQLASCLFAWVCVPRHLLSNEWTRWNRAYRDLLNDWGLYIDRAEYDVSRKKLAAAFEEREIRTRPPNTGSSVSAAAAAAAAAAASGGSGVAPAAKSTPKLLVELRCQCGQPLHDTAPTKSAGPFQPRGGNPSATKQQCPNPSCKSNTGFPMCAVCGKRMEPRGHDVPIERWFVWCTKCLHGGHMQHIGDWFRKHKKCPIEDCPCMCQAGDAVLPTIVNGHAMPL